MQFSNQASLQFSGGTALSNTTTGTLVPPLSLTKSASLAAYTPDCSLRYTVTVVNSSSSAYSGLSLLDDLGRYEWNGFGRFPMAYTGGTAALQFIGPGGVTPGTVGVQVSTDGMIFTFDLPASSTALLSYQVYPTPFAPLAAGSTITNTATLSGNAPLLPLTASYTLPIVESADLVISKFYDSCPAAGQQVRYLFTIANYGNAAPQSSDYVTLSDLFDPPLTGLSVTGNGSPWTEGNQYLYNEQLAYFQTQNGAIQLEAATFTQDSFGRWNTTPSSMTIAVTGILSPVPATQALMEVRPAYADGSETQLTAQRLQNDSYALSGTGAVPPAFAVLSAPDSPLSLVQPSDPRFTLQGNILRVDTAGLTGPVSASLWVDYGGGFVLQASYTP